MSYTSLRRHSIRRTVETSYHNLRSWASAAVQLLYYRHVPVSSIADLEAFDQERQAAWKYAGYPGLCKWLASREHELTVRKFEELNARVILKKQDDLIQVERELKRMDSFTRSLPDDRGGCGSLRLDECTPRGELLEQAAALLQDYNGRLAVLAQIRALPRASDSSVVELQRWLSERPNVLEVSEQEFARSTDLINLVSSEVIDSESRWWSGLGSVVMLLGPMWFMGLTCGGAQRLVIASLFELVLGILLASVTRLKPAHQTVILAAYFAILIVAQALLPPILQELPESHGFEDGTRLIIRSNDSSAADRYKIFATGRHLSL